MNNSQIIANAPFGATHVAFNEYNKEVKYLQNDDELINSWWHWVDGDRHVVDYDFTVVYSDIRSLSDIVKILELGG